MSDAAITSEMLNSYIGKTVIFTDKIDDMEATYVEKGMKAVIKSIDFNMHDDDPSDSIHVVHRVWVDYEPFENTNHPLMVANYYDRNGIARLTALESGWYKRLDSLYLSGFVDQIPFEIVE